MVVDGRVNSDEFLQTSHLSEAEHGTFQSVETEDVNSRLCCSASSRFFSIGVTGGLHRSAIGTEFVGDKHLNLAVAFHNFLKKFQSYLAVPALSYIEFQHLAFVINGPPKIVQPPADLHEHLVQMPSPRCPGPHSINPLPPEFSRKQRAEPFHQNRTVLWLISMPRSCNGSSTLQNESGKRIYIITARRMISCDVLR